MDKPIIDVAVAVIFFNRDNTLAKIFEQIRDVKPSKLFLIQDGPRENNQKDVVGVESCRRIVEDSIDWECEVHKDYSDVNLGCGMRVYSGITNAFKYVDKLIILEDDCLPSRSFFYFCKELLERYESDERIASISGMNHNGEYKDAPDDYFFCSTGTIWGWATWKRVWDRLDYEMNFQKDKYAMRCFDEMYYPRFQKKSIAKLGALRRKQWESFHRLSAWTYQFMMVRYLNSQLVVVPTRNLVRNIGVSGASTHTSDSLNKIPKGLQRIFQIPTFEYQFPLKHPKYIISDTRYDRLVWKIMGNSFHQKIYRKTESFIRRILFYKKGDFKGIFKSFSSLCRR